MTMSNLYDLSTALAVLNENIMENDGVLSEEFEQTLEALLPAITDKAGNISRWCRNLEGNIDSIDAEITRLRKRKDVNDHLKERLKEYLKDCMAKAGLAKLDIGIMTVSVQKNPPSVEITNEETVNAQYKTVKTQVVIDKKMLLEDLKAGIRVTGAELVTGKTHLRIR
jgi:hypothetical protein